MDLFWRLSRVLPIFAITACTTVPVTSMLALNRIDFATTRIEDLRIAVEIPEVIAPQEDGVQMEVVTRQGAKEDRFVFKLEEDQVQIGLKGLLPFPQNGRKVFAFRLKDKDAGTLIKLRQDRLSEKKSGEKGSLTVGISAKNFCRKSNLNNFELKVSTFIATSETKGFIMLSKDFDLRSDATVASSIATMPPCKS